VNLRVISMALLLGILELSSMRAEGESEMNIAPSKIERVVLFNSGVGYFERSGSIEDGQFLKLYFKSGDINDVLKSLVFLEVKGGQIERVDYPSKLPLKEVMEGLKVDLTGNRSLFSLLGSLGGEEIEIEAEKEYRGKIVGTERRKREGDKIAYLNILTGEGLISRPLESIKRIRFLNPEVESQFELALELMAEEHNGERKELDFYFKGRGNGTYRLAYMFGVPVWKMSYRLVLNDKEESIIQGWAIVENTTEDDWKDVSLSLVSGNPVSFTMDLYTPRFVTRPEVEIPLPGAVKPQQYSGAMEEAEVSPEPVVGAISKSAAPMEKKMLLRSKAIQESKMDITGGVGVETKGEVKGNFFSYTLKEPITIPVHRSAMVPVIQGRIGGKRLVVYNRNVLESYPLNGFEIENSTGLYLSAGPITIFEDGTYGGDARIDTLAPGEKRLITFSVDHDTEIETTAKSYPQAIVSVKIVRGIMESTLKFRRSVLYRIINRGKKAKNLLIEKEINPDWKLVEPAKPYERASGEYRFLLTVGNADSTDHVKSFEVIEERIASREIALMNTSTSDIDFLLKSGEIGREVKEALEKFGRLKSELSALEKEYKKLETRYASLTKDQSRIRNNMRALDKNSSLYKRYVTILSKQEDEIEKILDGKEKLLESIKEKRKEIEDYLASLNIQ